MFKRYITAGLAVAALSSFGVGMASADPNEGRPDQNTWRNCHVVGKSLDGRNVWECQLR